MKHFISDHMGIVTGRYRKLETNVHWNDHSMASKRIQYIYEKSEEEKRKKKKERARF